MCLPACLTACPPGCLRAHRILSQRRGCVASLCWPAATIQTSATSARETTRPSASSVRACPTTHLSLLAACGHSSPEQLPTVHPATRPPNDTLPARRAACPLRDQCTPTLQVATIGARRRPATLPQRLARASPGEPAEALRQSAPCALLGWRTCLPAEQACRHVSRPLQPLPCSYVKHCAKCKSITGECIVCDSGMVRPLVEPGTVQCSVGAATCTCLLVGCCCRPAEVLHRCAERPWPAAPLRRA